MKMVFIDRPCFVPRENYEAAIGRMVERLHSLPGILSVYQIGGIHTPGISDIDLVAVFADDIVCRFNPASGLDREDRYLFAHGIYGISRKHFSQIQKYAFFHQYRLIWGEDLKPKAEKIGDEEMDILKRQVALEYLVRWYISLTIEQAYGMAKLRALFLHARGALIDLAFLAQHGNELRRKIEEMVEWRESWFCKPPQDIVLSMWHREFKKSLAIFLEETLNKQPLFALQTGEFQLARHIVLSPGEKLKTNHTGWSPPIWLHIKSRKYFNFLHRWNRFVFNIPVRTDPLPDFIKTGYSVLSQMQGYQHSSLPFFHLLSSSLDLLLPR